MNVSNAFIEFSLRSFDLDKFITADQTILTYLFLILFLRYMSMYKQIYKYTGTSVKFQSVWRHPRKCKASLSSCLFGWFLNVLVNY